VHLPDLPAQQPPTCVGFCIFWRSPAIPLWLSPQVSPSGCAGGDFSDSHRLISPPTVPAINPDALCGHQLNETVRLPNLWKQVQNSSKFVDFTRAGALPLYLSVQI
jgi:hypothetical protein